MKRLMGPLVATLLGLLFYAVPAHAQYGNLPNQAAWNQYLANHPQTAAELKANPSLIYNPTWRSQHPHFETWANSHPEDWKMMRTPSTWQNRYGAWDKNEWHDQNWWYHHKPEWAHQNHPDWWQDHREWKQEKGEEHAEKKEEHAEENFEHHHEHDQGEPGDHGHHGDHGNH
jgi:hypothetical protein